MEHSLENKKSSFWPALIASAFLCFTLLFLAPIDMYLANIGDLWFSIDTFLWRLLIVAGGAFVVCAGVFLLLRKLNKNLYLHGLALFFGVGLAIYVQGYFLSIGASALEGESVDWSLRLWPMMLNLAIWIGIIVLPLIICDVLPKYFLNIVGFVSGALLVMQIFSVLITSMGAPLEKAASVYPGKEKEFDLSKNENVIVIILDAFGIDYFDEIIEKNPERLEYLDGFTYYPNFVGSYRRTIGSYTYLVTGDYYRNEQPLSEFVKTAAETDTFWRGLKEKNYDVRVLEQRGMEYQAAQMELFDNLVEVTKTPTSHLSLCKVLLRMTGYRCAPEALKPFLLIDFLEVFTEYERLPEDAPEAYWKNDNLFYKEITGGFPLTASLDENAFRLYFLRGAHWPYTMSEQAKRVKEEETSLYGQTLGMMTIVEELMRQLKELGLYDTSTVILMSDHAAELKEDEESIGSPIFLMKKAGDRGEMQISLAPASHEDFYATVMQAAGGDYGKYGTPVTEWKEGDARTRLYYRYKATGLNEYLEPMTEYAVTGDARDNTNYVKTGKVYTAP